MHLLMFFCCDGIKKVRRNFVTGRKKFAVMTQKKLIEFSVLFPICQNWNTATERYVRRVRTHFFQKLKVFNFFWIHSTKICAVCYSNVRDSNVRALGALASSCSLVKMVKKNKTKNTQNTTFEVYFDTWGKAGFSRARFSWKSWKNEEFDAVEKNCACILKNCRMKCAARLIFLAPWNCFFQFENPKI